MARPVCPECRQGKHVNCDGQAWDDVADQVTVCDCPECEERDRVKAEVDDERRREWWDE